jgi:hypothetical protein
LRLASRLLVVTAIAALVALALYRGRAGGFVPPPAESILVAEADGGVPYLHRRYARRAAIARDLAEGRASPAEAAVRQLELDRDLPPLVRDDFSPHWRAGKSAEERCLRAVLCLAHIEFDDRPDCRARLAAYDREFLVKPTDGLAPPGAAPSQE